MYSGSAGDPSARRRRGQVGVLVASVGLVAVIVTLVSWLAFPPKVTPERVDVVLVLAGSVDGRHEMGEALVRSGMADNLVVSNPLGVRGRVGYDLCASAGVSGQVETWCLDPLPATTTGEAQTFEVLAQRENWGTAVVVTNRPHHRRVRLNFDRCTSVETTVVSIDYINWRIMPYQTAREVGGFLKFWMVDPC